MSKKVLFVLMLAFFSASCSDDIKLPEQEKQDQEQTPASEQNPDEDDPGVDPVDTRLTFQIGIRDSYIENGDDLSLLDELHYALYSADPENISHVLDPEAQPIICEVTEMSEAASSIELCISGDATGKEFVLILWAQNRREEGAEFYDLTDLRKVRCADGTVLCNQEERVAYYLTHKFSVSGLEHSEELSLSRPHARLNIGTFAQALKRPDGTVLRLDQSSVSLSGVSDTFNTISGLDDPQTEVYGAAGEANEGGFVFEANDVPQKNIVINEVEYPYLALNYMFAAQTVNMDLVITGTPINDELAPEDYRQAKFEGTLSGLNLRQDRTTTVIAHFFGSDGRFEYDFRISVEGSDYERPIIIGDEDEDGIYDDEMDWGWAIGGDDTASGGGDSDGGDVDVNPDQGEGDDDDSGNNEENEKEDVRIETPDAVTWEVYTCEGLYMWAEEVRTSTTSMRINLKLFADLHLEEDWVPLTYSSGSFDGQGYTIYGLSVVATSSGAGFFTSMESDAEIGNINFSDVNISGTINVGVVAGGAQGLISNCKVLGGTVTGTSGNVGGLVGYSGIYLKIYDCENYAEVSGKEDVGGILGQGNYSTLKRCENFGTVKATGKRVAGICGYPEYSKLYDCINEGTINGTDYVGGIYGRSATTIAGAKNYGSVEGVDYVGGIAGVYSTSVTPREVSGCMNYGSVKGENYVGGCFGLFGSNDMNGFENHGSVTGNSKVGGLAGRCNVGSTDKTVSSCVNDAAVTGTDMVGGLVGEAYASNQTYVNFTNNIVKGTITGATNVGYLMGQSSATVNDDGTNITTGGDIVIVQD